MSRAAAAVLAVVLASRAAAGEKLGVIAVGDPPGGPDPDVTELAHQLRAACRDRVGGVEEVSTMRARLTGQLSGATLSELDRAYGGALAVYQNGEFESAFRTLRAIVEDLEGLPESDDAYFQWTRAVVRLAHAANTLENRRELEAAFAKLASTDVTFQPDADQYAPSFRKKYDEVRTRVRALPRRRLTVLAEGHPGTVYLNGRNMGAAPLSLTLPVGTYRVGGAAGRLRVPTFTVDLQAEDRTVILDFALAEALRVNAGPGLALAAGQRAYGIIRAGAWLGVDRLVVASRVSEGQAQFLVGSMYDVRRGALLREGSVRMVAGGVPSVNLAALASFLLTGQSSREVKDRTGDGPREIAPPPLVLAPLPVAPAVEPAAPALPPVAGLAEVSAASPAAAAPAGDARAAAASLPSARAGSRTSSGARAAAPEAAPAATTAAATPPAASAVPVGDALAAAAAGPQLAPAGARTSATSAALAPVLPATVEPSPSLGAREGALEPRTRSPLAASAPPERAWPRRLAMGSAVLAVGFASVAVHQGLSASASYSDADGLLLPDRSIRPGATLAQYEGLRSDGDVAGRNAYLSAGAAVLFAAAAGWFGWQAWSPAEPGTVGASF